MKARPRIDLDGVPLFDAAGGRTGALAIFRYRTTEGLVLLIPESADFTVAWDDLEEVSVDLLAGQVRVRFRPAYVAARHWLRGADTLTGVWLDRVVLADPPV